MQGPESPCIVSDTVYSSERLFFSSFFFFFFLFFSFLRVSSPSFPQPLNRSTKARVPSCSCLSPQLSSQHAFSYRVFELPFGRPAHRQTAGLPIPALRLLPSSTLTRQRRWTDSADSSNRFEWQTRRKALFDNSHEGFVASVSLLFAPHFLQVGHR